MIIDTALLLRLPREDRARVLGLLADELDVAMEDADRWHRPGPGDTRLRLVGWYCSGHRGEKEPTLPEVVRVESSLHGIHTYVQRADDVYDLSAFEHALREWPITSRLLENPDVTAAFTKGRKEQILAVLGAARSEGLAILARARRGQP